MKKIPLFLFCLSMSFHSFSQPNNDTAWKKEYRESFAKINDLVHTKLEVQFDYSKSWLLGKVSLTIKPHFYSTDSLLLDAKQMDITKVALINNNKQRSLKYTYDGWRLHVQLDKVYKAGEAYTVYIEYTAKPDEAKVAADGYKGLYFINPKGTIKDKPVQIWTDGEMEFTSYWCPVIDKPNQKTTSEIIMTVPAKYVTVSNGKLISQHNNSNGTRTDHWKMDLPLAPYLFFMAVGDFAIVKDEYKGKEVNYYVEKEYASTARKIFGLTPAMIGFFEKITGVPYPWVKYSQIALRDFTSTAMENTSITAHAAAAQQDERELKDGNGWENNIAHELFHQWFGDYVTCESWSNLSLNESFASYGQYLWKEHQYGADAAAEENYNQLRSYLNNNSNEQKDLIRFYYANQQDMFDEVSYEKGSVVLNMLRHYIGDSAFFKGMHLYLETNKFKNAEVHQLRLAMEEVTGKDLNWFFDQWYFSYGHPKVTIDYNYNDAAGKVMIVISQTQGADHLFKIPLSIDIYNGAVKQRHEVWLNNEKDTFYFNYTSRPDLVNVDADKFILWQKKDNKTLENFIYQYSYGRNYVDRCEAIAACASHPENTVAMDLLKGALKDKYGGLRQYAVQLLNMKSDTIKQAVEPILVDLAKNDNNSQVRLLSIRQLKNYPGHNKDLAVALVNDSSYLIAGEALSLLGVQDSAMAYAEAKRLAKFKAKSILADVIFTTLAKAGLENDFDLTVAKYMELPFRLRTTRNFAAYLMKIQSTEKFKKGIDAIIYIRDTAPSFVETINKEILGGIMTKKEAAGSQEEVDYIKSKL